MADDYLSDREQEEALRAWWRENWRWIFGGVALGLGLLGGWRYWEHYSTQRAEAAAALYDQLSAAVEGQNPEQAGRLLTDLTNDYSASGYAQQGRLLMAKVHAEAGRHDEALELLSAVSENADDRALAQVASLRRARLLIAQDKHDEALQLLDPGQAGAFAAQVRELRGDAFVAKGDKDAARAEYAAALAAADAESQIDRTMLEYKLQDVGGAAAAGVENP